MSGPFDQITPNTPEPITNILEIPKYRDAFASASILNSRQGKSAIREKVPKKLEAEIKRVSSFCQKEYDFLADSLNHCAKKLTHLLDNPQLIAEANRQILARELDVISEDIVNLERFIGLNVIHLMGVVKKCDEEHKTNMLDWFSMRIEREPFYLFNFQGFVTIISDLYFTLAHGFGETDTWSPPDSFDRKTTKFWVRPEHLLAVKLMICKHVPILLYGKKQGLNKGNFVDGKLKLDTLDGGTIVSVYFDNPDLEQYHARLNKQEGATLIRIRWYGKNDVPKSTCFIEQKTHHEEWVDAKSVKERFPLDYKEVKNYLDGKFTFKELVPSLLAKGQKKEQISSQWGLADEIQKNIRSQNLTPMIRTIYQRTAFQLTTDNNVRLSLDTKLTFLKEIPPDDTTNDWCRFGKFPHENALQFPLGVMEIKLNNEAPPWVIDLVKSGYLIRAEYFSKFQHSICIFFPGNVSKKPKWFRDNNAVINLNASDSKEWFNITAPLKYLDTGEPISDSHRTDKVLPKTSSLHEAFSSGLLNQTSAAIHIAPILPEKKMDCSFYLANERIFMKWIRVVFFLGTTATAFLSRGYDGAAYATYSFCLIIAVYAGCVFWFRKKAFTIKEPFSDPIGLTSLCSLIMLFFIMYAVVETSIPLPVPMQEYEPVDPV